MRAGKTARAVSGCRTDRPFPRSTQTVRAKLGVLTQGLGDATWIGSMSTPNSPKRFGTPRLSCLLSGGGHDDRGEDRQINGDVDDQPDPDQRRSVDPDRFDEDGLEQGTQGQGSARRRRGWPGSRPPPRISRFPAAASGLSGVPSRWRVSTPSAPSAPPVGPRPRGDVNGREPDRVGGHQALA